MAKVLLVSRGEDESFILRRKIETVTSSIGGIEFASVRPQAAAMNIDRDVVLVVHTMQKFDVSTTDFVERIRKANFVGPCLLIGKNESKEIFQKLKSMQSVLLLEKPYDNKDLTGIVQKFLDTRSVAQRIHRRFVTAQKAEVLIGENEQKRPSVVFNISKGGAYMEFTKTAPIHRGDSVKMNIELGELKRAYLMPAKVVWTTPIGMCGGYGVGVEFTGPGKLASDMYRG